jgi:pimeloyl-ACP methyl ester carboxylesterase
VTGLTTLNRSALATSSAIARPSRRRWLPLLAGAVAALAAAVAILVARDGALDWRVVRLLATVALATLAVLTIMRGPQWAASVAALAAGVVGMALGLGIGIPHVVKGADLGPTVAGLVCLVAGALLLAGGTVMVARTTRGWRRVGVVLVAVLVVAPLTYAGAIATAVTNVPPTNVGDETPGDRGLSYEDVEFRATDGVLLSGWYIGARNGAAVALLHGAGSTRSAVLDHATVLARHGYGVLLFDARGHGRSGGRAMDFGWYGDEDVGGAVAFLAGQPGVDAVGAVGMSMGGEEAIGALASEPRLHAVVAEGATGRVLDDRAWLREEYGIRGWLQAPVDWLTFTAADVLTEAEPPTTLRAAVAASTSPVLLITAGAVPDEARAGRHIASGSPQTVEMWDVPGTGHTDALDTYPEEWEARVTAFLAESLGVGPTSR